MLFGPSVSTKPNFYFYVVFFVKSLAALQFLVGRAGRSPYNLLGDDLKLIKLSSTFSGNLNFGVLREVLSVVDSNRETMKNCKNTSGHSSNQLPNNQIPLFFLLCGILLREGQIAFWRSQILRHFFLPQGELHFLVILSAILVECYECNAVHGPLKLGN